MNNVIFGAVPALCENAPIANNVAKPIDSVSVMNGFPECQECAVLDGLSLHGPWVDACFWVPRPPKVRRGIPSCRPTRQLNIRHSQVGNNKGDAFGHSAHAVHVLGVLDVPGPPRKPHSGLGIHRYHGLHGWNGAMRTIYGVAAIAIHEKRLEHCSRGNARGQQMRLRVSHVVTLTGRVPRTIVSFPLCDAYNDVHG